MRIKTIVVPSLLLVFGLLAGTSTQAQAAGGRIWVTGAKTPGFTGLNCSDIVVQAVSTESTGKPALTSKWQRHTNATGSWASGTCFYEVKAVANSLFYLLVTTQAPCDGQKVVTTNPPYTSKPARGGIKTWRGQTKTVAFSIQSIKCVPIK
jgi:hypothetical protein